MKNCILMVLCLFSLVLILSVAVAEEDLTLPNKLMHTITHETDYDKIYQEFISHAEDPQNLDVYKKEDINKTKLYFTIEDITIDGINYDRIVADLGCVSGGYVISLEYTCSFGEKIEDSQIFINTVNQYNDKYKPIGTNERMMAYDEHHNSVSTRWKDVDTDTTIMIRYFNGDVSELLYPTIHVHIGNVVDDN